MQDYEKRLKIPVEGNESVEFYTKCGSKVSTGYNRIVIGKRGPYIEFSEIQINKDQIYIPDAELWRIDSDIAYYIEYRTNDTCNVKIYFQKKVVNYADYLIGKYYISPFDLKTSEFEILIETLKVENVFNTESFF